jgi:potassium-transporting ATPase KdpC subunit
MLRQIAPAFRLTIVLTVLTGLIYPGVVTGLARLLFPHQAKGSLVEKDGKVVGSRLIGQTFTRPDYFHGRPSAAGDRGYDSSLSNGSNLGPTSQKLYDRVKGAVGQFRAENPEFSDPIPADALTASGSGLDPDISPASAMAQVKRVAEARGTEPAEIQKLVDRIIKHRDFGFLGEPRVNVLELNLALDQHLPPQ